MTSPRQMLRTLLAGSLAIAGLGITAQAQHPTALAELAGNALTAQQAPDQLAPERLERMVEIRYADDEPVRIGGRLQLVSASFADGMLNAQVRMNWRDNRGTFVDGIKINCEVHYRASAGLRTDTDTFVPVSKLGTSLVTNFQGVANLRMRVPNPETGLMPGEYYVKFIMGMAEQTDAVRNRLMTDPSIVYLPALPVIQEREKTDIEEERKIHAELVRKARELGAPMPPALVPREVRTVEQILADYRLNIQRGVEPVNPTQFKLFVGTTNTWVDDGTLGHITELEILRDTELEFKRKLESVQIDERNEKDPAKKEAFKPKLAEAEANLNKVMEEVNFRGGRIKAEELMVKQRVEARRKPVVEEILAFEDALVNSYITVLNGDLSYWYWKAATLYGNVIYSAVKDGKLPWENTLRPLTYGPDKDKPKKVTDLKTWREYTIERLRIAVDGDSKTWPENGYTGPANSVRRGGFYSQSLLTLMIADVNAFDPMKYLNKVEKNAETQTEAGYSLKEEEWMLFEEQFRTEMGYHINNLSTQWQPKPMLAFRETGGRTPLSTGDRVRALNLAPIYGHEPTRFNVANQHLNRSLDAVAYMPMAYRFWIYTSVEKLSGSALQRRLGSAQAFPTLGRRTGGQAYAEYKDARDNALRQLERYRPTFRNLLVLWAATEGQNRNWPKEWRDTRVKKAQAALAARSSSQGLGDEGEGDAVIKGEGDAAAGEGG